MSNKEQSLPKGRARSKLLASSRAVPLLRMPLFPSPRHPSPHPPLCLSLSPCPLLCLSNPQALFRIQNESSSLETSKFHTVIIPSLRSVPHHQGPLSSPSAFLAESQGTGPLPMPGRWPGNSASDVSSTRSHRRNEHTDGLCGHPAGSSFNKPLRNVSSSLTEY